MLVLHCLTLALLNSLKFGSNFFLFLSTLLTALANIVFFECDVSKYDQVQKVAKEIIAEVSVD